MKHTSRVIYGLLILVLILFVRSEARLFFVGSNPYRSFIAYPQDILRFDSNYLFYYTSYQKLPWWGDVDEPTKKPNDTYVSTAEKTVNDKKEGTSFEHGAGRHMWLTSIGVVQPASDSARWLLYLDYTLGNQRIEAEGNLNDQSTNSVIPFSYEAQNASNELYLLSIYSMKLWQRPCGIKLGIGFSNNSSPDVNFSFTKGSNSYSSSRLLWGFSTAPCSHIFGATNPDGDAWLQSEYAIGPLFRFDIQGGTTLDRNKVGTRFRYLAGKQDQYYWKTDSTQISVIPDQTVFVNFIGDYVKSEWVRKTRELIWRLYDNITWRRFEHVNLNTLLFLGYDSKRAKNALSENLDIESDRSDRSRNVVVEVNPNVNIFAGKTKQSFIDLALLVEYSYTRFENTAEYWAGGGKKESYVNSDVYVGKEYSWEDYSYANEHFFDAGIDMDMTFPLLMAPNNRLALGLSLFVNLKYTWLNKYFGTNSITGSSIDFVSENIRKNYKREIWFNSLISLHYWHAPLYLRFELFEPLLYSLLPRTRVSDATGNKTLYEFRREGTWASQEGVKFGLFVSYDMALFKRSVKNEAVSF